MRLQKKTSFRENIFNNLTIQTPYCVMNFKCNCV